MDFSVSRNKCFFHAVTAYSQLLDIETLYNMHEIMTILSRIIFVVVPLNKLNQIKHRIQVNGLKKK